MLAAVLSAPIVVAAAAVDARVGEILALAKLVENRPRPPMKVRIDNVHVRLLRNGSSSEDSSEEGVPGQRGARLWLMAMKSEFCDDLAAFEGEPKIGGEQAMKRFLRAWLLQILACGALLLLA